MRQMVRKQIYIAPHQEQRLKRLARERGISEAELVRRGLDVVLNQEVEAPREPGAWEEEKAFIQQRGKLPARGGQRTWRREEAYEGRLSD